MSDNTNDPPANAPATTSDVDVAAVDQADAHHVNGHRGDAAPNFDGSVPTPDEDIDLDGIARSFDEIESALRRLDQGTYFDDA